LLAKTPGGLTLAKKIYEKARPNYHSVTRGTIDEILEHATAEVNAGALQNH